MVRTQGTGIFTEDVVASGSVTAPTGIFPFSLTVSGVPVATGTAPPAVVVPSGLVALGGGDERITAVSGFAYDAFRNQLRLGDPLATEIPGVLDGLDAALVLNNRGGTDATSRVEFLQAGARKWSNLTIAIPQGYWLLLDWVAIKNRIVVEEGIPGVLPDQQLLLDSEGRVGVGGLTTATHTLHVAGSGIVEDNLEVQGQLSAPSGAFTQTLTISGAPVLTGTLTARALSIENPDDAEDMTFFFTNQTLKLDRMQAVIVGTASPSITWTIRFAENRSAAGTEIVAGGTTTSSLTTGSNIASFTNGTIPVESWVWLETTANAGSVALLTVTLFFDQGG